MSELVCGNCKDLPELAKRGIQPQMVMREREGVKS